MKKICTALVAACLLAGCAVDATTPSVAPSGPAPGEITDAQRIAAAKAAPLKPATPQTFAKIKAAAVTSLKDPGSAQWANVREATRPNVKGQPMRIACGLVNGKNAMGGYIGFKRFVYVADLNQLLIAGGGSTVDDMIGAGAFATFCGE